MNGNRLVMTPVQLSDETATTFGFFKAESGRKGLHSESGAVLLVPSATVTLADG